MSTRRIKVADLPRFDTMPYLDSDEAIAAYPLNFIKLLTEFHPSQLNHRHQHLLTSLADE